MRAPRPRLRRHLVRMGLLVALAGAFVVPKCPAAQAEEPAQANESGASFYGQILQLLDAGRYPDAARLAERAAKLLEDAPDDGGHFPFLLGSTFTLHGDYARAEPIFVRLLGAQDPREPNPAVYESLGRIRLALGDMEGAAPLLQRAVAIAEERFSRESPYAIGAVEALAALHRRRGERRRAEELLRDLESRVRTASSISRDVLSMPALRLGELALDRGELDVAEPLLKAALAGAQESLEEHHVQRAPYLHAMGLLLARRGDFAAAEAELTRALVLREAALHPDHPEIAHTLRDLGDLYVAEDRIEDAVRVRARAADLADHAAHVHLGRGSEDQKRAHAAMLQEDTDALVSLHLKVAPKNHAAARLALTAILRRKGIVLDAVAGSLSALRQSLDSAGRALFDERAQVDARLSAAVSRGPIDVPPAEHLAELEALERRRRALDARLSALPRAAPDAGPAALLSLEDVQRAIPAGAVLVELVVYRPYDPSGPPVRPTWGAPRLAAYVLRHEGEITSVDLGNAEGIEEVAAGLLRDLATPRRDPRPAARYLDSLVTEPLRGLLGDTRWILLSPDGALNLVPFSALVDAQGTSLVRHTSFTYLTSGRELLRLAKPPPEAREAPLVVVDPAFGARGEGAASGAGRGARSADMTRIRFSPLPATRSEGAAVKRMLPGARLLEGTAATEEALLATRGPLVLHVATHGFFLPDQPAAGGRDEGPRGGERAAFASENPLLRAGLALFGANGRRSTTDAADGVLTALEISGLDLRGTRLVVLSACETGVGEALRGEGVFGLRRALAMAGAETQVMSLWQVDDEATSELMTAYYTGLAAGGGRSEALRAAQLAVREKHPHPYYWASFIVSGNGAALDGRSAPPRFALARGPRGCACQAAGAPSERGTGLVALAAGALALAGRRRRRAWNVP
ncbi:CHAT domain-containing tetratricopeptide repeat protein [Polyangium mundeleinium]|uniref:CHAT domain-containing tetratricopeptide repeat protein n=1 Tax=Polyangium mundeleinium TaxID=2995306 RepID=A0ABT5EMK5_9BACT|nr:CHAT domain-containing protein [Polyangium mundeleinium]MDC0743059.1 CHAT domain-containing tetratricopeptide repeat protein [Polyangium mundeleinium]